MTGSTSGNPGRAKGAARPDREGAPNRAAEFDAENAALRRALAHAGLYDGRTGGQRDGEPAAERAGDEALQRANAALRDSEERLRLILDSAADYAIFTTGPDLRIATWNAGAERLLGWSAGEVVGRSVDRIFTAKDRATGVPEREAAKALAEGRAENERWHLREDGSRFWASGLTEPEGVRCTFRPPTLRPAPPE